MGFFDKLKGAVNAISGGAAKVTIATENPIAFPGEPFKVQVTATSTGAEIKSKGIFIDVEANEEVSFKDEQKQDVRKSHNTFSQTYQIATDFVLAANETKVFEGTVTLPPSVSPSYTGTLSRHVCSIRGRVEAFGNDPDSGFQPIKVGQRA